MTVSQPFSRPWTTGVLAMSADGKIAAVDRTAARFSSAADSAHLQTQVAQTDAVLFGATTLRAYGSALRLTQPHLLQQRQQQGLPSQPVQIVCARSPDFDPGWRFFQQDLPRWLLTTPAGADQWRGRPEFDRVLLGPTASATASAAAMRFDWSQVLPQLVELGVRRLALLGGGMLVASLLEVGAIDELWLTVCPLLLGGAAPTPVAGDGFSAALAPRLRLLAVRSHADEVFLHYRVLPECGLPEPP